VTSRGPLVMIFIRPLRTRIFDGEGSQLASVHSGALDGADPRLVYMHPPSDLGLGQAGGLPTWEVLRWTSFDASFTEGGRRPRPCQVIWWKLRH